MSNSWLWIDSGLSVQPKNCLEQKKERERLFPSQQGNEGEGKGAAEADTVRGNALGPMGSTPYNKPGKASLPNQGCTRDKLHCPLWNAMGAHRDRQCFPKMAGQQCQALQKSWKSMVQIKVFSLGADRVSRQEQKKKKNLEERKSDVLQISSGNQSMLVLYLNICPLITKLVAHMRHYKLPWPPVFLLSASAEHRLCLRGIFVIFPIGFFF